MKIAVFTALKEERAAVRKAWNLQPAGSLNGSAIEMDEQLVAICTGMGPHRMTDCVERVREVFSPSLLILIGFSAGLKSHLKVGDLVADPGSESALLRRAAELHPKLRIGPVASSGFLHTAREKATFAKDNPDALVTDLESGAFMSSAGETPYLVVRAVSDTVDTDLPLPFEEFVNARGFPNEFAIAKAVAKRPRLIGRMLTLAKDSHNASGALANFLTNLRPVLQTFVG